MTAEQRESIEFMRRKGLSYPRIGAELGLSVNTVKSYGRRAKICKDLCMRCRKPLAEVARRKSRKFCSDECRIIWWKKHRHLMKKKAFYPMVCAYCGCDFQSYGNKNRKYCGRDCYIKDRFGEEKGGDI